MDFPSAPNVIAPSPPGVPSINMLGNARARQHPWPTSVDFDALIVTRNIPASFQDLPEIINVFFMSILWVIDLRRMLPQLVGGIFRQMLTYVNSSAPNVPSVASGLGDLKNFRPIGSKSIQSTGDWLEAELFNSFNSSMWAALAICVTSSTRHTTFAPLCSRSAYSSCMALDAQLTRW